MGVDPVFLIPCSRLLAVHRRAGAHFWVLAADTRMVSVPSVERFPNVLMWRVRRVARVHDQYSRCHRLRCRRLPFKVHRQLPVRHLLRFRALQLKTPSGYVADCFARKP